MINFLIFFYIINLNIIICCKLDGDIEGQCIEKIHLANEVKFCYDYIDDYVCVPFFHELWPEYTNETIDKNIEKKIVKSIENEFIKEIKNNVYILPLINKIGCMNSYINFICQKNFMTCDKESNLNQNKCKDNCNKFISKCGTWSNFCENLHNC